jgi:hypothetical protein
MVRAHGLKARADIREFRVMIRGNAGPSSFSMYPDSLMRGLIPTGAS